MPLEPRELELGDLRVFLREGVTVSGQVVGLDRKPAERVMITVRYGGQYLDTFRTFTDESGAYTIDGLPPGGLLIFKRGDVAEERALDQLEKVLTIGG